MYLIVGLGNFGNTYDGTRHNIGFETINKLAYDHNIAINKAKMRAHFGEGFICGQKVILVKPQTYMNLSGEAVSMLMQFYKLSHEEVIVVFDDTDLPLDSIRIRQKGSAGGHNGVKSLIWHMNTDEFLRVKIGIGEKPQGYDLADYVLSRFKKEEIEAMQSGVTKAGLAVETILKEGVAKAMNQFNPKPQKKTKEGEMC